MSKPIDTMTLAHQLAMPAAVFSALHDILNAEHDPLTHYTNAIKHLSLFGKHMNNGVLKRPAATDRNTAIISGVKLAIFDHAQVKINSAEHHGRQKMVIAAYLACLDIISLYDTDFSQTPVHHLIEDAIENLNAAVFWASRIPSKAIPDDQLGVNHERM